eukprot:5059855-Pyramimonas_sp.AAC.1
MSKHFAVTRLAASVGKYLSLAASAMARSDLASILRGKPTTTSLQTASWRTESSSGRVLKESELAVGGAREGDANFSSMLAIWA